MKKKRNIKIFSFVLCLVATLFALGWNRISAETPEVSISGKLVDTISNVQVSNNEGGNLDWELGQWATFRINADFNLAGKNVKKGDTTDITVPDALIITSQSFEIRDVNSNEIIAHAKVDKDNKKLSLTYTDYVEKHSDTQGSFFFYARIDFKKHPQKGEIPIEITVNGETKIGGKVSFKGIGDGNPRTLTKTSWVHDDDKKVVSYTISVNRTKQNIKEATLEDHLKFTNASYVPGSIRVIKGKFAYVEGEWQFSDRVDVTDQHTITISEDGQSFVINLGDISENDQYRIAYDVQLNYEPVDGELLKNDATLKGKGVVIKEASNAAAVQIAGGAGKGYVFTVHIHKVNDENQPLAGAKFKVVRQANNQEIGEYVTDANGDITVNALLKDKYILTETEAPEGYTITTADTLVNPEDFGADHKVTKTIVNPKAKPKTTQATIELNKTLTGRSLTDGEFSFDLYEGENKLQTATNQNGKVTFAPIEYSEEGVHEYTVKEVSNGVLGITYDLNVKKVKVTITKEDNQFKSVVEYPDGTEFKNIFTPSATTAVIELDKALTGRSLTDDEFSFDLYEGENKLQTATNQNGKVTFEAITYKEAGEHTYTVKEVVGNTPGITYDTTEKQVIVKVTQDGANLKADLVYPENKTFNNTYTAPKPGSAILSASKILKGRDLKEGEFYFQLLDQDGNVLQTKQNIADGSVTFDAISYSEAEVGKTFTYSIKEVIPESKEKGMVYDEGTVQATVTVSKDEANNQIVADVQYGGKNTFTNTFVTTSIPPTPPTVDKPELKLYSIQLHKVNNEGKPLVGAIFGLFEADGTTPVANPYGEGQATATSDANGLVTFTGLVAKDYVVKEITAPEGYQLSEEVITVSASQLIASTDQVLDQGKVVNKPFTAIPPTPPTVDKPELKLYNIQLHKVNLVGQDLAGAVFGLFEADGVTPVANPYGEGQATATSDANGLVSFVGFEAKDYVIKELTAPAGYQLSTDVITVSASELKAAPNLVVDKGTVVNYLTPPNTPPTPPTPPTTPPTPPTPPTTPPTPPTPPTTPSTDKPKGDKPSGSQPKEEKKHTLPSTGETVSEGLVAAGLALAVAGSALVYKKREN